MLRYYPAFKQELEINYKGIIFEGVEINVKYAYINGKPVKYKAEYNDCVKLAKLKIIAW